MNSLKRKLIVSIILIILCISNISPLVLAITNVLQENIVANEIENVMENDIYGNGYMINAHNIAYGLDNNGQLSNDALFKGPLNFVSMSEGEGGLISVKAQDNIAFAVYENVKLSNLELKSCNLLADSKGQYDLTDLNYVGTTVEVFGDNVTIEYSRISNGRNTLRIFGDYDDPNKVINTYINNSVLSSARDFIIRMGSNSFEFNPEVASPRLPNDTGIKFPVYQNYYQMTKEQKQEYDEKFIKTFVNALKNDAAISVATPLGSLLIQATGGNAGGPVTCVGTNLSDSISRGIIQ